MNKKAIIHLIEYDVEAAQDLLNKNKDDVASFNYWIGWHTAKEQDLLRVKKLNDSDFYKSRIKSLDEQRTKIVDRGGLYYLDSEWKTLTAKIDILTEVMIEESI